MSEPSDGKSETAPWRMRLDCGHVVAVPWGTQPPFVLACVVQHQHLCEAASPERVDAFLGASTLRSANWAPAL